MQKRAEKKEEREEGMIKEGGHIAKVRKGAEPAGKRAIERSIAYGPPRMRRGC
jgi:hypothetical protein